MYISYVPNTPLTAESAARIFGIAEMAITPPFRLQPEFDKAPDARTRPLAPFEGRPLCDSPRREINAGA